MLDFRDPVWVGRGQLDLGEAALSTVPPRPPSLCELWPSLSLQASSQLSRGSATTPRGILHTFSQSPKLQNAASAATRRQQDGRTFREGHG